jgi:hypothetical protein
MANPLVFIARVASVSSVAHVKTLVTRGSGTTISRSSSIPPQMITTLEFPSLLLLLIERSLTGSVLSMLRCWL